MFILEFRSFSLKFLIAFLAVTSAGYIITNSHAATIVVDSALDDGLGGCTLREAVIAINIQDNSASSNSGCAVVGAFDDDDTITFSPSLINQTIVLNGSQIDVSRALSIDATSVGQITVDADNKSRVFLTDAIDHFALKNMTIMNGSVTNDDGGGISTEADNVELTNVVLLNNAVEVGRGGGFYYSGEGEVSINDSSIEGNQSSDSGGGGAYFASGKVATIQNSEVINNKALGIGGSDGGGLHIRGINITIVNTTISGNFANDDGGAFTARNSGTVVKLIHSSLINNEANSDGSGIDVRSSVDEIEFVNTIVYNPIGRNNCREFSSENTVFTSDTASIANNLGNCSNLFTTMPRSVDPLIEDLEDNGGGTRTHSLPLNSPARDSASANCQTFDQRGERRDLENGLCDVGAFELTDEEIEALTTKFLVIPTKNGKVVVIPN